MDLKQFSLIMLVCISNVHDNILSTKEVNYDLLKGDYDILSNYNNGASYVARCKYVNDTN